MQVYTIKISGSNVKTMHGDPRYSQHSCKSHSCSWMCCCRECDEVNCADSPGKLGNCRWEATVLQYVALCHRCKVKKGNPCAALLSPKRLSDVQELPVVSSPKVE